MPENIRLVIWDLDETFWKGTLTEGGHTYDRVAHDAVIALARRGIMSSICSKNDLQTVKAILQKEGIWDYFIFPSVNWEPKGARIKALIDDVQLRPESVLFIDDNHLNLKEATYYVPGLQVASEAIIPSLLADPLLVGKDDSKLTRLQQYKVMETRKADQAEFVDANPGGNIAFLRESGIRVRIEHDVEKHLDRVIELINRTNQLNFTKRRLPEKPEKAKNFLLRKLSRFDMQVGLVEVSDKYGDYGYCGYFQVHTRRDDVQLLHFCFSCRILNMGVEAWVYQRLGRPELEIVGEVLSDPVRAPEVDWITLSTSEMAEARADEPAKFALGSVAARGACNLWPLVHYFQAHAPSVTGEYNTVRDGKQIRIDHSVCLRQAITGVSAEALAAVEKLGYVKEDFETNYFAHSGDKPIWLFSNWVDINSTLYRHKATGIMVPFKVPKPNQSRRPVDPDRVAYVLENFEPVAYGEDEIRATLELILSKIPAHGSIFFLMPPEPDEEDEVGRSRRRRQQFSKLIREATGRYPNAHLVSFDDFILDRSEIHNDNNSHFDRKVYYRVFERIKAIALSDQADSQLKFGHG